MRQLQLNLGKNFIYVPSDKEVEANQVSIRSSILEYCKKRDMDINIYSTIGYNLVRTVMDVYMDGKEMLTRHYLYQEGAYNNYVIPLIENKHSKLKVAEITEWEKAILTRLHWSWFNHLRDEINSTWFSDLLTKINGDERNKYVVYPSKENVFKSFETDISKIRVCILAQDPYSNDNANGFAFATNKSQKPVSLQLIEKAIREDFSYPDNYVLKDDLLHLVNQGILLLNSSLTVRKGEPNSHAVYWEKFIQRVIETLNGLPEPIVFILMGAKAAKFKKYIGNFYHTIYEIEHPARAAYEQRSWEHNNVFNKTNQLLKLTTNNEIKWILQ